MKNLLLLLCFSLLQISFSTAQIDCNSQIEYFEVNSEILRKKRQIKLQLPRNYDPDSNKTYPLIFVFDGDYLFEPVAGIADYLGYWEEIPEAFVVGINQVGTRIDDGSYDKRDFLPVGSGAQFFDFIQLEVLSYLKDNYNIGEFTVAVGHDYMANFTNFFLFSDRTDFQGYINLSPDIADGLVPYIKERLQTTDDKIWYTLATGSNDVGFLKKKTEDLYNVLEKNENEKVTISFNSFENTNHYTFVGYAIPFSLTKIFAPYTPIDAVEYETKLSKAENPVDYLIEKYDLINSLYDLNEPIRISDIMQVSKLIEKNETWDFYQDLSKVAKRHHTKTLLFDYFSGRYYQEIGKPKRAIKAYLSAYSYEEAGGITKEMVMDEADKLKEIFGY